MKNRRTSPGRFLIGALVLFFAAAFARPAALEGQDTRFYVLAAVVSGVLMLSGNKLFSRFLLQDRILVVICLAFCGWSILLTSLTDIDAAETQAFRCAGALILMIAGSLLVRILRSSGMMALLPGVPALILLILPLILDNGFGTGFPAIGLLMISFVILLSSRKQLFSMLLGLSGTVLLLAGKDPAAAAVWSVTFLLLFWAYSGHPAILLAGTGLVLLSGLLADLLIPGLLSPSGTPSVFSEINPGWIGLEMDDPFLAAAASMEMSLFQRMAVRYGWIVAAGSLALYPVIILRGSALACASGSRLQGMAVMGSVLLTGLTALAALLSDFGIWTVSGISLPGLTQDSPSLCIFLFLMGICGGVSSRNRADLDADAHIAMLAD